MEEIKKDESAQFDHRFETEDHRTQFIAQLSAGHVSLKFAFSGSASRTYQALAATTGYLDVTRHTSLELDALAHLPRNRHLTVVDIGSGDGGHAEALVRAMIGAEFQISNYIGVDFSGALLQVARSRLTTSFGVPCDFRQVDLEENALVLPASTGPRLFLLLGNIIGNILNVPKFLQNATISAEEGDELLIGAAATQRPRFGTSESVLIPYSTKAFERAIIEPFLAAGVERAQMDFSMDAKTDRAEAWISFNSDVTLRSDETSHVIRFGHRVRSFVSRRFDPTEIVDYIRSMGWRVDSAVTSEGGIAVLGTKVRHQ